MSTENDTTNLNRISEQYRTAARADFDKAPDLDDDTPAKGPLPVTGGETQMPGTERLNGTDAQELSSPDPEGPTGDADGKVGSNAEVDDSPTSDGPDGANAPKPAKKTAAKKSAAKK